MFRLLAVLVVPALVFASFELGLRTIGTGHPAGFLVDCEVGGRQAHCANDRFGWLFFPPRMSRAPMPLVVPADKPESVYRIGVLGASAAQGDPDPSFGVARILEVMLREGYPGIDFEVVNAAVTALNSHAVVRIADELASHDVDAFLIYLGNNEVVGPYGAGTVFSPLSPHLAAIRASLFFKSTRSGQLLEGLLGAAGFNAEQTEHWGGMEMFLGKQVRHDSPALANVYQHFRSNLEAITDLAIDADIETVVSTVAVNLKDSPPFASLHRRGMSADEISEWDGHIDRGVKLEQAGNPAEASESYLAADAIDDQYAELQFRLGRSYLATGDADRARERFVRARDLDTLRFRADSEINEIIRSVVGERSDSGVALADAARAFSAAGAHGLTGKEFFHEHVHFNFDGNYFLAVQLLAKLKSLLPPWVLQKEGERPLLSRDEARQRLAYTDFDRNRVLEEILRRIEKPPFANQLDHEARIQRLRSMVEDFHDGRDWSDHARALGEYAAAMEFGDRETWLQYNLAALLVAGKEYDRAEEHLRAFLDAVPPYPPAYDKLTEALLHQGRFADAAAVCRTLLERNPDFVPARYDLAYALANLGSFEQAIAEYRELLRLDPAKSTTHYNEMGRLFIRVNKLGEAAQMFRNATTSRASPESSRTVADAYFNLGDVLKKTGATDEARAAFREAATAYRAELSRSPREASTHTVLGRTLMELGEAERAEEPFRTAVTLAPSDPLNWLGLIHCLEVRGQLGAARAEAERGIAAMTDRGAKDGAATIRRYAEGIRPAR